MRTSFVAAALVGIACLLLLPATVQAETAIAESIEWVLATSDRIVVGKVIEVDIVTDGEKRECQAITVAISKTLKGPGSERVTLLLPPYIYSGFAKQWMDEGIPIVFCLTKNDGKRVSISADRFAWVLRDNGNGPDSILLGKSKNYFTGCIPILTRDFEVLVDTDAILKFLEKTIKAAGKNDQPRSLAIRVPGNTTVYKKLWSLSAVYLIVPVDEKLEALGQKWCKSELPGERTEGANILSKFKSEKNIELLKPLLNDPSTSEATLHRSVAGKTEMELVYRKKLYYVRQAAFDALRELGAEVARPVLEELLEGTDVPDPKLSSQKQP
jgi:hypothetical protein